MLRTLVVGLCHFGAGYFDHHGFAPCALIRRIESPSFFSRPPPPRPPGRSRAAAPRERWLGPDQLLDRLQEDTRPEGLLDEPSVDRVG